MTVRNWMDLTAAELAGMGGEDTVAVLPLAAVEQHGPHLPLGTDLIIGEGLLQHAMSVLSADLPVLLLPAVQVGTSSEHLAWSGTLSLPPELLVDVLVAQGRAVAAAGIRRLVLGNSHGGNHAAMDMAALRLRRECGMLVVKASYVRFPSPQPPLLDVTELRHGLHGGALETAMMLHLAPERVNTDHLAAFRSLGEDLERTCSYLRPEGPGAFAWLAGDLHPSGVAGNAAAADAETGGRLVAHYGGVLAALIEDAGRFPLERLVPV
ncbi:creatininase family protein [Aquisalimonas sp. 2447]|uniref:creatininase family protein n=1 Tax=Aquisalimonas sp. 2447 TaxID=2740807 RepID=UPI0014327ED7|nr:creatininase family protein [Aquisalimonas sp. 2447]QIT56724.1 creatininase family protein [Aquisalimonas sp. 2447]